MKHTLEHLYAGAIAGSVLLATAAMASAHGECSDAQHASLEPLLRLEQFSAGWERALPEGNPWAGR